MNIPRRLAFATVASLASLTVVLVVLGLARRRIGELLEAAEWRSHSHEVTQQIERVLTLTVDAETGVRGCLLTGDGTFLEPYEYARAQLPDSLARLRRLTADNPAQLQNVIRVETLAGARLAGLAYRLRVNRNKASSLPPDEIANLVQGKEVMDALRVAIAQAQALEAVLLDDREEAVRRSTATVRRDLNLGAGIGALLLLAGLVGFGREIRLRWQAEGELQHQTMVLRSVLESITDGVAVANPEGRFTLFNRAGERILGVGAASGGPSEWPEHFGLFRLDGTTRYSAEELPLPRALKGETARDVEILIRNPHLDAPVLTSTTASPLVGPQGQVLGGVAVFRDVTAEREGQRALRVAKEAAEQARDEAEAAREAAEAANTELEAFSYSVSHDLRAPLRAIDGFSQALVEDYGHTIDDEGKRHLDRVRAAAQRMALLIDDLIKLSRINRAELAPESTDVSALARDVVREVSSREPERVVGVGVEDGLHAHADPRLLRVALENLISNSWKFTRGRAEARVDVGADRSDGQAAFYVRDNGAGFDMAYADKLFGAFQRLHSGREFEGTGIGLATVARVVRRHGGRVWAEAEPGAGATFFFTLGSAPGSIPEEVT